MATPGIRISVAPQSMVVNQARVAVRAQVVLRPRAVDRAGAALPARAAQQPPAVATIKAARRLNGAIGGGNLSTALAFRELLRPHSYRMGPIAVFQAPGGILAACEALDAPSPSLVA